MASARGSLFAGVDLGGTKIQTVIIDEGLQVRGSSFLLTPRDQGSDGVIAAIVDGIRRALDDAGVEASQLAAAGIGAPGRIDMSEGTVAHAGNLVDWARTVPVAGPVGERLGCPVVLRGDVQSGVIAEARLGAGRDYRSLLGVFTGTGVGGGLILDGQVWRSRGAAGEIGHMVARDGGRRCPCGLRGCLEAYAGRAPMERIARKRVAAGQPTALFAIMDEVGRDTMTGEVWAIAVDRGDDLARSLVDDNVAAMGIVIASAVNLLDVEAVLIGGGLALALGERYVDAVRSAMAQHLLYLDHPLDVRLTELGELGGALGAALAAQEEAR